MQVSRSSGRIQLTGVIVDAETERPVEGAQVWDGKMYGVLTDSMGWFRLAVPAADSFEVYVARIEYTRTTLRVEPATDSVTFVVAKARLGFCPLIIGELPPRITLMLRNADTGMPVAGAVTVRAQHWITSATVESTIRPSQGAIELGLKEPGPYTLFAQARGYANWELRKTFVWQDPCNPPGLLENRIQGRMVPAR